MTHRLLPLLPLLLALSSCDLETSDNGRLDGFWHLEQVDTLSTGGQADLRGQRVFWAVQARLVQVRDADRDPSGYYLRFRQTADSLTLHSPHDNGGHEDRPGGGDTPLTDASVLAPYGILHLEEHYLKERLTGSAMTLRSEALRLHFKKF